ncbi:PREDICTED: uncharacterized protein At4g02000-like [Camelina sativa]|uniref:Uncharacterized protein At4g02000-like n=1 Tax=Camelina sativa TaxID=90675 RepID=A0ABM1QTN0_CAMSA|nr:PREDICTED: uncharacterized protein At4g02000-like [Camelina sativa]XP_019090118.1 PREDICTED: uncharacterized protein At4g02000-like [Camelina sativa]
MIGFEYEKLKKVCTNCCCFNHDLAHCPYLAPPAFDDDYLDVPLAPGQEEEVLSVHNSCNGDIKSDQSSAISSYSPISQPPRPASPAPNLEEFLAANPLQCFPSSSSASIKISSDSLFSKTGNPKENYEIGESSKRKKGKQVHMETDRNTRQCRKDPGLRMCLALVFFMLTMVFGSPLGALAMVILMKYALRPAAMNYIVLMVLMRE